MARIIIEGKSDDLRPVVDLVAEKFEDDFNNSIIKIRLEDMESDVEDIDLDVPGEDD